MKRPIAVGINFDFELNCCGYSDDVIPTHPLPNNFTNQRFVFAELMSLMTAKRFLYISIICEITWFIGIDI